MNIDKAIRIFADFLNKSWITVFPLLHDRSYTSDESSKSDWLQANWEMLVERKILQLNEHLEVYGEGADFNGENSRVTDIKAVPTHSVKILINNENDILNNLEVKDAEFIFDRLVGFKDGFYTDCAPFDFVLVQDEDAGIERVFLLDNIKFELQLI